MSIYAKEFRKALGFTPYPGTLNLLIKDSALVDKYKRCIKKAHPIVIEPPRIPGAKLGKVFVYPATLSGLEVFVVRPAITVYKFNVIEVIAEKRLRDLLGLEDGDEVVVEVCCE
jgi:riboflavin kinase